MSSKTVWVFREGPKPKKEEAQLAMPGGLEGEWGA
jgi:hypothetical protein